MPGKRITQQQIRIYMQERQNRKTKKVAAARSGFSERTGYTVEKRGFVISKPTHDWMTRKDPFEAVWVKEIVPLLEDNPHLQAKTLLEEMQRRHPGEYSDSHLRTLQRRVRKWKALSGPGKEVIFRQNHPPGWQGISDFTDGSKLRVTIHGEILEHKFYHYRLVYSKWEAVSVILGGESFTALSEGLQNALWKSGGVPQTHRTDSLSAAYRNCSDKQREAFTESYSQLCAHYGMEPTRNNKGIAHENGAIEAAHGHLKTRVDQALMLRGSREFSTLTEYKQFIEKIIESHNRRVQKAYMEERSYLKASYQRKCWTYLQITPRFL